MSSVVLSLLLTAAAAPPDGASPQAAPRAATVADALAARIEAERLAHLDATAYDPSPYATSADLPPVIAIERSYQAFNDHYYFALVDGKVWYKPRFKRPTGEADWVTDYAWKPLGHAGGLPYLLDVRKPEKYETTWIDGTRGGFVPDLEFVTATPDQAATLLPPSTWEKASVFAGEAAPLDPSFPSGTRVIAITADDDEIAVLTDERRMFYRRKYANLFVSDNWTPGWGQDKSLPVYFPAHLTGHKGWSLGRITAAAAGYKEGPDGRIFEWGPAAVSMETMVWLDPNGRKVWYLDSGTPPEVEHFIEAPFRGQWRGEGINAAASTVMVIDRFGAVQTKIGDFDLLGSTPTHPYCYAEDCDDEVFYAPGDIRSGMSDIRLPPEGWLVHPPVREDWPEGTAITSRVTILQTGKGNTARELRVQGMEGGVPGYFYKGLTDTAWSFRAAPPGDRAFADVQESEWLSRDDLAKFTMTADLAALHADEPVLDRVLSGELSLGRDVRLPVHIPDANPEASPWTLHVRVGGEDGVEVPLQLHLVQAWNRYMPAPAADPAKNVTTFEGTLTADLRRVHEALGPLAGTREGMALRAMILDNKNRKFAFVVDVSGVGARIGVKSERRSGDVSALFSAGAPATALAEDAWIAAHAGQMRWVDVARAIAAMPAGSACDPDALSRAAAARFLDEKMSAAIASVRDTRKEARGMARFTFATSGLFYLFQVKTLDAALDARRSWRSPEVRPNELRFNVITGVTTRIPYLARHIAQVEGERLELLRDEADLAADLLAPALKAAKATEKACGG